MTITASEQYMIELINRARLDPAGETARHGIALNDGLPSASGFGTVTATAKQVVAPIDDLDQSATGHSNWMASTGTFSHSGSGGSDHTIRIRAAGYDFAGSWHLGENLALVPTSRGLTEALMDWHHDTLLNSPAHRSNMLDDSYREIGVAESHSGSQSYVTENFGYQSSRIYVTGVAYSDNDHDNFYSVGEGRADLRIAVTGGNATHTADVGGYALVATTSKALAVEVGSGATLSEVLLNMSSGNVKLDVVNGDTLLTSGHMTLVSGIADARLLGIANLNLTGSTDDNTLRGNVGSNTLSGMAGDDLLKGGAGKDKLFGGSGADSLAGDGGNDVLNGNAGADRQHGNAGSDVVFGNDGNDVLFGDANNDRLYGGAGGDALLGGSGNDLLAGSSDNDWLKGETGADTFVFSKGYDHDKIADFSIGESDHLRLDNALWGNATLTDSQVIARYADVVNGNVVFDFGTDALTLMHVNTLKGLSAMIDVI